MFSVVSGSLRTVSVVRALPIVKSTLKCLSRAKPHPASPHVPPPTPRPQHGEVLPLKIVTYAAVSLSLAALLVAFVLLTLVRTLRSNLHGIHRNLIGALFCSQLVFVIGITQTGNPVSSRALPPTSVTDKEAGGSDRGRDWKGVGLEGGEDGRRAAAGRASVGGLRSEPLCRRGGGADGGAGSLGHGVGSSLEAEVAAQQEGQARGQRRGKPGALWLPRCLPGGNVIFHFYSRICKTQGPRRGWGRGGRQRLCARGLTHTLGLAESPQALGRGRIPSHGRGARAPVRMSECPWHTVPSVRVPLRVHRVMGTLEP